MKMTSIPITSEDLEAKRKQIQGEFDREIADGVVKDKIRRLGGEPDAHWQGFDVAR